MNRELKFDLNVSDGLQCPNPSQFFSGIFSGSIDLSNYKAIPNVLYKTKIATAKFDSLLQDETSEFTSTNSAIKTVDVDVCALSIMNEVCQKDLETTWLAEQVVQGTASYESGVNDLMAFYWLEMQNQAANEMRRLIWGGDSAGTLTGSTSYLNKCDGFAVRIDDSTEVVKVSGATAITASNVIAELTKLYTKGKSEITQDDTTNTRIYMAPNVAAAYRLASAQGNTMAYITKGLDFTFLDIKIVVEPGMSPNSMVLGVTDSFIYAFNAFGTEKDLNVVDLDKSLAIPKIRARAAIKIGTQLANPDFIVSYGI